MLDILKLIIWNWPLKKLRLQMDQFIEERHEPQLQLVSQLCIYKVFLVIFPDFSVPHRTNKTRNNLEGTQFII